MTKKEQIEARIKQLKAQLNAEAAKEAKKERAARTRELIQFGALLVADESPEAKKLVEKYQKTLDVEDVKRAKSKLVKKEKPNPKAPANS